MAWRDNEVTADHPLAVLLQGLEDQGSVVDRLEPKPLNVGDIRDLVADTLSLSVDKIDGLATLVNTQLGLLALAIPPAFLIAARRAPRAAERYLTPLLRLRELREA